MQKHREFPILFIRFNIVPCQRELICSGEPAGLVGDLKTIYLQFDIWRFFFGSLSILSESLIILYLTRHLIIRETGNLCKPSLDGLQWLTRPDQICVEFLPSWGGGGGGGGLLSYYQEIGCYCCRPR